MRVSRMCEAPKPDGSGLRAVAGNPSRCLLAGGVPHAWRQSSTRVLDDEATVEEMRALKARSVLIRNGLYPYESGALTVEDVLVCLFALGVARACLPCHNRARWTRGRVAAMREHATDRKDAISPRFLATLWRGYGCCHNAQYRGLKPERA